MPDFLKRFIYLNRSTVRAIFATEHSLSVFSHSFLSRTCSRREYLFKQKFQSSFANTSLPSFVYRRDRFQRDTFVFTVSSHFRSTFFFFFRCSFDIFFVGRFVSRTGKKNLDVYFSSSFLPFMYLFSCRFSNENGKYVIR